MDGLHFFTLYAGKQKIHLPGKLVPKGGEKQRVVGSKVVMERDYIQNRKRTRDEGDEKLESHKGKKQEFNTSIDDYSSCMEDNTGYEFCDAFGVFDFPWLKEGAVFKVDDYLEPEDMFAQCLCLDNEVQDQSCVENSAVPLPQLDRNFHDQKYDGDGLWSFQVDNLEPIDPIWSSFFDQPLENVGVNKASLEK